jgi:hypothetical protein
LWGGGILDTNSGKRPMSDSEVIRRVLSGDDALFAQIVARYSGYVWAVCSCYLVRGAHIAAAQLPEHGEGDPPRPVRHGLQSQRLRAGTDGTALRAR